MHDDNGRGVQSQVLNRESNLGISNIWATHPELEFTPLIRDRVGLICRPDHPLAKTQTSLKWSDLGDYDFVGTARTGCTGLSQPGTGVSRPVIADSLSRALFNHASRGNAK